MSRYLYVWVNSLGEETPGALMEAEDGYITKVIRVRDGDDVQEWREDFDGARVSGMKSSSSYLRKVPDNHNSLEMP